MKIRSFVTTFLVIAFSVFVFVSMQQPVMAQAGVLSPSPCPSQTTGGPTIPCIQVNQGILGFKIPDLSQVLTFAIRAFFIIAGLAALLFLLLGALAWVTSGGDKENVSKAQGKITNAIIGVILIAVVLAVIVTLEQVVFAGRICMGLSCPITIPGLVTPIGQ